MENCNIDQKIFFLLEYHISPKFKINMLSARELNFKTAVVVLKKG